MAMNASKRISNASVDLVPPLSDNDEDEDNDDDDDDVSTNEIVALKSIKIRVSSDYDTNVSRRYRENCTCLSI